MIVITLGCDTDTSKVVSGYRMSSPFNTVILSPQYLHVGIIVLHTSPSQNRVPGPLQLVAY